MKINAPNLVFKVVIEINDGKKKTYWSTDFPTIGDNWITIYQNTKRIIETTSGVVSVEYDIVPSKDYE